MKSSYIKESTSFLMLFIFIVLLATSMIFLFRIQALKHDLEQVKQICEARKKDIKP